MIACCPGLTPGAGTLGLGVAVGGATQGTDCAYAWNVPPSGLAWPSGVAPIRKAKAATASTVQSVTRAVRERRPTKKLFQPTARCAGSFFAPEITTGRGGSGLPVGVAVVAAFTRACVTTRVF